VVGPLHWVIYPALASVAATVVLGTPVRIFGLPLPEPILPLVLAFAWPLIRPSMLGPAVLFLLGVFEDLFMRTPLGFWTLALLGVYAVILFARSLLLGQETRVLLGWWLGAVAGAFIYAYFFRMFEVKVTPGVVPTLLQFVPTALLFPLAHMLVQRFDDGDVRFR
jgi:rod shape-determining protein MreD